MGVAIPVHDKNRPGCYLSRMCILYSKGAACVHGVILRRLHQAAFEDHRLDDHRIRSITEMNVSKSLFLLIRD